MGRWLSHTHAACGTDVHNTSMLLPRILHTSINVHAKRMPSYYHYLLRMPHHLARMHVH